MVFRSPAWVAQGLLWAVVMGTVGGLLRPSARRGSGNDGAARSVGLDRCRLQRCSVAVPDQVEVRRFVLVSGGDQRWPRPCPRRPAPPPRGAMADAVVIFRRARDPRNADGSLRLGSGLSPLRPASTSRRAGRGSTPPTRSASRCRPGPRAARPGLDRPAGWVEGADRHDGADGGVSGGRLDAELRQYAGDLVARRASSLDAFDDLWIAACSGNAPASACAAS